MFIVKIIVAKNEWYYGLFPTYEEAYRWTKARDYDTFEIVSLERVN